MAQSGKVAVDWTLKNLDTRQVFRPQFPIGEAGVSFPLGGQFAEQGRHGFQDPVTNWQQGKTTIFTFPTMLFARSADEGEDVLQMLSQLAALTLKNEDLGRPPICLFTYGKILDHTVLVEAIDPTIRKVLRNGSPQEVRLNITLRKYVPFSQQNFDITRPAKESFYLVASAKEKSYEAIARKAYGDPLLGDRLRKRHPDFPFAPELGNIVRVPARSVIAQEVVEPTSHIFDFDDDEAVSNFERILEARNARKLVIVR